MEYKRFTDEQLSRAKNADTVEFLKAYYGFDFRQAGRYYQCVQHDSLMIYGDRKGFVWNSRDISGGDAIDLLRKVEGKSFPEAVEKMATAIPPALDGGLRLTKRKFCFIIAAVGMVQPEFTPVELVGYEDNEAGSPLTLDNG